MDQQHTTREKKPTLMKGFVFLLILGVIGAGLGAATLALRSEEGPKVAQVPPAPLSVPVISAAMQNEFALSESFTGLIAARRESQLGFTAGGRIASLTADVGDRVTEGQRLALLDTRALRSQLAAAEAVMAEIEASRELALTTLARQASLRDAGHVSQQVVDEAAAQASAVDARGVAAAAQADTLRVQIDLSEIRAPFDGVITQRLADEGVIAAPGQSIFELVESGALEARIGLPSAAVADLVPGQTYTLIVDGRGLEAVLRTVTGVIGERQRTVTVIFDIADGRGAMSGAVARLPLQRPIAEHGMWLPVTALTEATRGLWSVLVASPTGGGGFEAHSRLVEIVHTDGSRAFVRGAVETGDMVILDGLHRITPGQPVAPRLDTQAASSANQRLEAR